MSVLVFIGTWFLPTARGVSGYMPIGEIWRSFITREYIGSANEILVVLAVTTCSFALVAVVVGWLLQFPICIVWKYFRRGGRKKRSA